MKTIVTSHKTHTTIRLRDNDSIESLAERMEKKLHSYGIHVIHATIEKTILTITTPHMVYIWSTK